MLIKSVCFKNTLDLLGKSILIQLRDGGAFQFYCNESGIDYIAGYDDQSLNVRIDIKDIEFIMEG